MGRGAAVRRLLAAAAVLIAATGCSGSEEISTAGVDELVIPTPSPDPDDFVAEIDNPWLPLEHGARWTYEAGSSDVTFAAGEGPTIEGVDTTAVEAVTTTGDASTSSTAYYAQDTDGNVWSFGTEGEWQAGDDGAQAGMAMLAEPRVGDGYAEMATDGEPGLRSVVTSLEGDSLLIESTTPEGDVLERHYERGTGLVLSDTPGPTLRLVERDAP